MVDDVGGGEGLHRKMFEDGIINEFLLIQLKREKTKIVSRGRGP